MVENPGKILEPTSRILLMGLVALVFTGDIRAETAAPPTHHEGQELGQAADDPTASLMSFQLADWYTASYHNLDDATANSVVLRSVLPFKTGNLHHIARATVPFQTSHPILDSGLSDITLFDLVVFPAKWGRWGAGAVALLPTGGPTRGTDKWALGPAVGFTVAEDKLLWGLFNQNIFTVGGNNERPDVDVSIIQVILSLGLKNGWSIGASELTPTYDWNSHRWTSLPLGERVSKLVKFGKTPVQFSGQYEYNFASDQNGPQNTIRLIIKALFPA